ncbi:MAG: PIN domain-containing protein [Mycobacteriales bacterium]
MPAPCHPSTWNPLATEEVRQQALISIVALVELHWVLRRSYKVSRTDAVAVIRRLLAVQELVIHQTQAVHRALTRVTSDVDFSDALIAELGFAAGCDYTATFDQRATRLSGMRTIP